MSADPHMRPGGPRPADLVELQRARLLGAAVSAINDGGLAHLTVARIIAGARVSRTTFYEIFNDAEDCVHFALTQILTDAELAMRMAHAAEREPLAGVRAALGAMLEQAERNPAGARLCFVEALAGGPRILRSRGEALERAAAAIDGALAGGLDAELPTPISARAAAGAVAEMLHARLLGGEHRSLMELQGALMAVIVMPYLGRDAALKEISRSTARQARSQPAPSDPLADLGFRLTYRTMRVLIAVAEMPGASNREIARHAAVADAGQISKLLRRLEGLALLENRGEGHTRGKSNAWWLTAFGSAVQSATEGL